jgi:chromosome segregation ATPase
MEKTKYEKLNNNFLIKEEKITQLTSKILSNETQLKLHQTNINESNMKITYFKNRSEELQNHMLELQVRCTETVSKYNNLISQLNEQSSNMDLLKSQNEQLLVLYNFNRQLL